MSHVTASRRLLKPAEAAEYLRVHPNTLRWYRHKGIGPRHIRISERRVLYSQADLEAYVDAHTVEGVS